MTIQNLIEGEKWTQRYNDEKSCPKSYDIQRYRDVKEHNGSIHSLSVAMETVCEERDSLLVEVIELIGGYKQYFSINDKEYYRGLLDKYGIKEDDGN